MADLEKLRGEYEAAEAKALKLQADKDEAMQKVLDRFRDRQREANQAAATAQSDLLDAEVQLALSDRPDRDDVASSLRKGAEDALTAAIVLRNTRPDGTLNVEAYEAGIAELRKRANTLGFDHLPFYTSAE
jgi:hypothetical protein